MKGVFWNIRGLNKPSRIKCLADFIRSNNLDFFGVQETKKEVIPQSFLDGVCKCFSWNFIPAKGTIGGTLVGCRSLVFESIAWQGFEFCVVTIVKNKVDNLVWRLVVVYGSPYEKTKGEIINELHLVMDGWHGPTLMRGDFNLVRNQHEKSNGMVNFNHSSSFNDRIERWGLIEFSDPYRLYTWSNNQDHPIMAKLDMVLASMDWESRYPLARVTVLSKGVSDHNPVLVDWGAR
jgi:exonuclease III